MRTNISSPFTFFFKFITPALWFAVGLLALLTTLLDANAPNEFLVVAAVVVFMGIALGIDCRNNIPLKKASFDDNLLYVANYIREIQIPLSGVADVRASAYPWLGWWRWPPYRVIITLEECSEFGKQILIVPGFYYKDVVELVRNAVSSARRSHH